MPHPALTHFGTAPDGSDVHLVTLTHAGTTARVMTYGASLQDFRIEGVDHALVLGAPDFEPYLTKMRYFGATAGPVANRIAKGRAPLNGTVLELERNENNQTMLHSGSNGSSEQNWMLTSFDDRSCVMRLEFADGTGGLPGPIDLTLRYSLDDEGALLVQIEGTAPVATFCNPAHHSYWTLDGSGSLQDHKLVVQADRYLPVDQIAIPLGAPQDVVGGRFDFRTPRAITRAGEPTLDHNFCLKDPDGSLKIACSLWAAGLQLDVATTEPGLQVYDGAGLDTAPLLGHENQPYGPRAGLAIEPQRWPDAPNNSTYPSILLTPGQRYAQLSRFHVHKTDG
ncbi:MAG: galactose mutarotase [Thalassovita sp.]